MEYYKSNVENKKKLMKMYKTLFTAEPFSPIPTIIQYPNIFLPNNSLYAITGNVIFSINAVVWLLGTGNSLSSSSYKLSFTVPTKNSGATYFQSCFGIGIRDSISPLPSGIFIPNTFLITGYGNYVFIGASAAANNSYTTPVWASNLKSTPDWSGYTANVTANTIYTISEVSGALSLNVYDPSVPMYNNNTYFPITNPLSGGVRSLFMYMTKSTIGDVGLQSCGIQMVATPI